MVLFYESTGWGILELKIIVTNPACPEHGIISIDVDAKDETLIRYARPEDIWFHVDKLSSPHIYLRLPSSIPSWEAIPKGILDDCAQLVKAGSITGNKVDNLTVIYTPASNLKKTGDMAAGQVSFFKDHLVKRVYVAVRENGIVNRLNKTRKEVEVDHEAELVARQKQVSAAKKAEAAALKKQETEERARRQKEKDERSYTSLFAESDQAQNKKIEEDDDDFFM